MSKSNDSDHKAIIILGAQGFIGKRLRQRLCSTYTLHCVDVRPLHSLESMVGSGARACEEYLYRYDLGDPDQIIELFNEIGEESLSHVVGVVHLAAYYDFRNQPDARYDRLHRSLPALIMAVEHYVPDDAALVYASSMAAMAPTTPGKLLTEESPRLGAWAYPQHKIMSERMLEGTHINNPVVQLVLSGVYSDMCELVPLYQQIERVRTRSLEAYFYPGEVEHGLTYVHVEDCADAFARAIKRYHGKPAGVHRLLIGEARPVSYRTIHEVASEVFHGRKTPILPVPRALAKLGAWGLAKLGSAVGHRRFIQPWMVEFAGEHFEFDLSKTRRELGWEPTHDLHRRLERILRLAAHHPELWTEVNVARPW
jgi:nucleoside-diphosphate-sugar epimerase